METWDRKDMWPFKLLIGVLTLVLLWALFGSERLWVLNSRPMIIHRTSIKIPPQMTDLIAAIDYYGVHLPREPSKAERALRNLLNLNGIAAPIDSFDHMTDPAMGYSVREWGFVGMPFGYTTEEGPVVYVRNDWGTLYSPLTEKGIAQLNAANGRDVTKGGIYPFWTHLWGWAFVFGLGLAGWLWSRGNARRREELGLID